MLNQVLIEEFASDLKIAPLNIIREYLEIETLYYLSQCKLSEHIIFYGGTALRLAYQSFRFSEDLDFLLETDDASNKKELKQALQTMAQNNKGVAVEEIFEKRNTIFGLLHIENELLKHAIRIKIEICKKKNGVKSENFLLASPINNKDVIFKTADLESLHKMKETAIKNRNMPRDWFDYWYLCQKLHAKNLIQKKFLFNKKEFENDLKRWLPRDKWKIIKTVIDFYENN
ncbi:MAG: nucleotidyl transferase AbiEii/AbiGii toxin family protein [bacterium]